LHVWAVGEGLRGADASRLFDSLCQRLVGAGLPLWRAFAGMKTLHPQWGGYGYTWRRHLNAIQPAQSNAAMSTSDDAKPGAQVVAASLALWEHRESEAIGDDAARVGVGPQLRPGSRCSRKGCNRKG
jgi:hypothetical protein